MSGLTGLAACVFGNLMFTLAPVPREAAPDPLARGYMGITVQTGGGLAITDVTPGTGAAKAGLKAGDVITRVGTLEPQLFEQVVSHICSFRPGAVVEIEVRRGTDTKTFKVKLAARPIELDAPGYVPGQRIIIDD